MERLTKRKGYENESWVELNCAASCAECANCKHLDVAINRLAAYEDTGRTPEKVVELIERENRRCETIVNLTNKEAGLRAELSDLRAKIADGRLVAVVRCGECVLFDTVNCPASVKATMFTKVTRCTPAKIKYCAFGERREKE